MNNHDIFPQLLSSSFILVDTNLCMENSLQFEEHSRQTASGGKMGSALPNSWTGH